MKVYVVTSTELVRSIQRNHKTISFDPLINVSIRTFSGIKNKRTEQLLLDKSSGGEGLNAEIMHAMTPNLIGEPLDRMNSIMMQIVGSFIRDLEGKPSLDLYRWVRDMITAASTEVTYGPMNPYHDPAIVDAFWYVLRTPSINSQLASRLIEIIAIGISSQTLAASCPTFSHGLQLVKPGMVGRR